MLPEYSDRNFRHVFHYRVRSHECDRQGVVHNAKYLEMLEIARIEYCRDALDIPIDPDTFVTHHKFFFVRNALNYFSPARFDEELTIFTRVGKIGRTSVTLEQIINAAGERRIVECESVMVSVDPERDEPVEISIELREQAKLYEAFGTKG